MTPALLLDAPSGGESQFPFPLSNPSYSSAPLVPNVLPLPALPTEHPSAVFDASDNLEGIFLMEGDLEVASWKGVHTYRCPVTVKNFPALGFTRSRSFRPYLLSLRISGRYNAVSVVTVGKSHSHALD